MNDLDLEEAEILDAFDKGILQRSNDADQIIEQHRASAEAWFEGDAHIDILLSSRDLCSLQMQAIQQGMPYQIFKDLIDLTDQDALDVMRSRSIEQEVLDMIDEPKTR